MKIVVEITTDPQNREKDDHLAIVLQVVRSAVADRLPNTRVSGLSWKEET